MKVTKKLAAVAGVGGAIAVAATGCGADGSSQATAAAGSAPQGAQTQGARPQLDTAALAKKLGVTQAKLKTALDSVKPAAGQRPQPNEMAAKLAKALGLSQSKVEAALKAVMPQGGPPSGAPQRQGSGSSGTTTS